MARTEAAKAGKYEQLVDRFDEYDDKNNLVATYEKGDIVSLNAEQAERLATGDSPSFAAPGARAQAEADRLQAAADEAKARADEAKARAVDAAKDARAGSTARSGGKSGSGAGGGDDDAPAGNASLDEWRAYALEQEGVTEESIKDLTRDQLRELFTVQQS